MQPPIGAQQRPIQPMGAPSIVENGRTAGPEFAHTGQHRSPTTSAVLTFACTRPSKITSGTQPQHRLFSPHCKKTSPSPHGSSGSSSGCHTPPQQTPSSQRHSPPQQVPPRTHSHQIFPVATKRPFQAASAPLTMSMRYPSQVVWKSWMFRLGTSPTSAGE